jgi:preprotein translocase subunit Sec63
MSALAGSSSANLQTRYAFPRLSASVSMIVHFTFSKYDLSLLFTKRSYFSCQIHLTIPVRNTFINMEDLSENPPTEINPYEVLEIETTATPSNVKSAYKKLALRHHPGIPNL